MTATWFKTSLLPAAPLKRWLSCWLLLWAARLLVAWAASRPVSIVIGAGRTEALSLPDPGQMLWLELLRLRSELLVDAFASSAFVLLGAWVLMIAATTGAVALLWDGWAEPRASRADPEERTWLEAAWYSLGRVLALSLLAAGAAFAFGTALTVLVGIVRASDAPRPVHDAALLGGTLLALIAWTLGGIAFDLTRAHLVGRGSTLGAAFRAALGTFTNHFLQLLGLRLVVALGSLALFGGAAFLWRVEATLPMALIFTAHRLTGAVLAALRVTWLGWIVGLTARAKQGLQP